ncbi:hypothetical protein [Desulfovibrio sp. G11]|uniref:hypothetical protein n=1 Tax=Desulfovibrio sp. G11 TaxID=631220 RepID=UPI0012FDE12E|nr:hypothetical protein [Desulfovibrio sp. G11]
MAVKVKPAQRHAAAAQELAIHCLLQWANSFTRRKNGQSCNGFQTAGQGRLKVRRPENINPDFCISEKDAQVRVERYGET